MWLCVNKDGQEWIYRLQPERRAERWRMPRNGLLVPKGTIKRLLNYPLTWDDEAQEIKEYKEGK